MRYALDRDGDYEHPAHAAARQAAAIVGVSVSQLEAAMDISAAALGGRKPEIVFCEAHGPRPHVERPDCVWPHLVGPAGPHPSVGHPYTPHD